jgi:hypothetical protein
MAIQFITPSNLHAPDFNIGTEFPNKISLKMGAGLVRLPGGEWTLDEAAVEAIAAAATTNVLSLTGSVLDSTVNGVASNVDLAPFVESLTGSAVEDVLYDPATGTWTINKLDGSSSTINTPLEKFLADSSIDNTTHILTLTLTDGNEIEVDLAGLVDVIVIESGDTTTVSGDGSTATPFKVEVKIDPASVGLTASPAGLLLDPSTLPTLHTVEVAGNTLTSTVNGVAATADVVTSVELSAGAAPGSLVSTVNGVASTEFDVAAEVRATADLEMQDAFGNVIGYAFTTNA